MNATPESDLKFPKGLLGWAGHHSGGVKRLFDPESGRPVRELLRTHLISRLEAWAKNVALEVPSTPRIILLVGGPGNGKTEAIEHTINRLDEELGAQGRLAQALSISFHPPMGQAVSREVKIDAGRLAATPRQMHLSIVQDASTTAGSGQRSAPESLAEELLNLLDGTNTQYYLCCVNRGVLDDALIHSLEHKVSKASELLETITRSVSLSSDAPSCWPLDKFPDVAVWPMDAESLLISPGNGDPAPANTLLTRATDPSQWPTSGNCAAGDECPFCQSRALLDRDEHRSALLKILRWYELASGKRWSFRDLFSLTSYLLAGNRANEENQHGDPCQHAAWLLSANKGMGQSANPRPKQMTALFELVASSYQHALFHRWDPAAGNSARQCIRDLALDKAKVEVQTLLGLQHFLSKRKDAYLPATIAPILEGIARELDPAMASPDVEVAVSSRSMILLGELDTRFSRSIAGGIEFIRKYQVLSNIELELLKKLAQSDGLLSDPIIRRKNPAAASRLQRILRDFSCRLVRRSICTRSAVVADFQVLDAFQQVVEDDDKLQRLFEIAKQVKNLLNSEHGFEVSLTTTFGQPLPPQQRQAILVVPVRQVRMKRLQSNGRPRSPLCFLEVGNGQSQQSIALTYDLFKAVKELDRGMSPASLPRNVVALLDTTKARLSGPIVRDQEILVDAQIKIGIDGAEVGTSWDGKFVSNETEKFI